MLPTPNTTVVRDDARCGHFTHASARSRNAVNAAAFAGDELMISILRLGIVAVAGATGTGVADFLGGMEMVGSVLDGGIAEIFSFGIRNSEFGILPAGSASARNVSGAMAT